MAAPPSTQRWRTLVLIYPVLDARYGSGLVAASRPAGHDARRAGSGRRRSSDRLPATVLDWSDGLATLDPFDIVEVRRPLTSLSSSGGGRWWVGPREVRPELTDVAGTGARYDSVYALWPCDPEVPQCGWGCSLGSVRRDVRGRASRRSRPTTGGRSRPTRIPQQGYVHEWLHQVEGVFRGLGVSEAELPPLHDAGDYTSTRSADEPPTAGRTPSTTTAARGRGRRGTATG